MTVTEDVPADSEENLGFLRNVSFLDNGQLRSLFSLAVPVAQIPSMTSDLRAYAV